MSGAPLSKQAQQALMDAEFLVHHGGITVMFSGLPNHCAKSDLAATIDLLQAMQAEIERTENADQTFAHPVDVSGASGSEGAA